jgi:hypothetical protein
MQHHSSTSRNPTPSEPQRLLKKPRWTKAEEDQLIHAVAQGLSSSDIAKEYFRKTRTAKQINDKISRLRQAGRINSRGSASATPLSINQKNGMCFFIQFILNYHFHFRYIQD